MAAKIPILQASSPNPLPLEPFLRLQPYVYQESDIDEACHFLKGYLVSCKGNEQAKNKAWDTFIAVIKDLDQLSEPQRAQVYEIICLASTILPTDPLKIENGRKIVKNLEAVGRLSQSLCFITNLLTKTENIPPLWINNGIGQLTLACRYFVELKPESQGQIVVIQNLAQAVWIPPLHAGNDLLPSILKALKSKKIEPVSAPVPIAVEKKEAPQPSAPSVKPPVVVHPPQHKQPDFFDWVAHTVVDIVAPQKPKELVDSLSSSNFVKLDSEEDSPPDEKKAFLKHLEGPHAIRMQQTKTITHFCKDLLTYYLPSLLKITKESPLFTLKGDWTQEFEKQFPDLALQLFFHDPRNVSAREVNVICSVLEQVHNFFQNYGDWPASANEIDKLIIAELKSLFQELASDPLDYEEEKIEKLKTPVVVHTLGALLIADALNRIITPYHLCLILDRILDDSFDLDAIHQPIPDQKFFTGRDAKFNTDVGKIIQKLGEFCLKLGNPTGVFSFAADHILKPLLLSQKSVIATTIQQAINQATNTECPIKLILFLDHLLFKREAGKDPIPICLEKIFAEEPDRIHMQSDVAIRVQNKVYQLLLKAIKEKSALAAWGVDKISSIEGFCKSLVSQIWNIVQDPKHLKLLTYYLVMGFRQGIAQKVK
jgi:hypothetical protein